jgi:type VI secretion system Hcp family effector
MLFISPDKLMIPMQKTMLAVIMLAAVAVGYIGITEFSTTPQPKKLDIPPLPVAYASFDTFLELDALPQIGKYSTMDIHSFEWGVNQTGTTGSSASGAVAGKAFFDVFVVIKHVDQASPVLYQICAEGRRLNQLTVHFTNIEEGTGQSIEYKMTEVVVNSVRAGGSPQGSDTIPLEQVSFSYNKIQWT